MNSLGNFLNKPEIIEIWNNGTVIIRLNGEVVFHIINNCDVHVDKIQVLDDELAEFTDAIYKYDVTNTEVSDNELIIDIIKRDESELIKLENFGINVTLNFLHGVEAESYEEAVKIVKDDFLEKYNIELQDNEIDPEKFDLRSVLDLLDKNGYEDASNFLRLHFAKKEGVIQ